MFSCEQVARKTPRRNERPIEPEDVNALAMHAEHGRPAPVIELGVEIAAQLALGVQALHADGERPRGHARHRTTRNAEPLDGSHFTMFGDVDHRYAADWF